MFLPVPPDLQDYKELMNKWKQSTANCIHVEAMKEFTATILVLPPRRPNRIHAKSMRARRRFASQMRKNVKVYHDCYPVAVGDVEPSEHEGMVKLEVTFQQAKFSQVVPATN